MQICDDAECPLQRLADVIKSMRLPSAAVAALTLTCSAVLAACGGDSSRLPTAPAAPAAPAEPGRITVAQLTPLAGPGRVIQCYRVGTWCSMLLIVDVQFDQEVTEPWVTASFYNGSVRCGGTTPVRDSDSIDPHYANSETRFTLGPVLMLAVNQNGMFCPGTTRMVVQLWAERGRSAAPLLTREFAHSWTIWWSEQWE